MTSRALLGLIAFVVLTGACGEPEEVTEFETILDESVRARGDDFAACRDRLLAAGDAVREEALGRRRADADSPWRERFVAWVLDGWRTHEPLYRGLLETPRRQDPAGRLRYPWVTRRSAELERQLPWTAPLLLELLLLETAGADAKDDALALLPHVAKGGHADEAFLLEGTRPDSGLDLKQRRLLAWALASITRPTIEPLDVVDVVEADGAAGGDRYVARYLLDLVGRASGRLKTDGDRNAVSKRLLGNEPLALLVDPEYRIQRVGRVGGSRATSAVLKYQHDHPSRRTSRWVTELAGDLHYSPALGTFLMRIVLADGTDGTGFASTVEARSLGLRAILRMAERTVGHAGGGAGSPQQLKDLLQRIQDKVPPGFFDHPAHRALRALRDEIEALLTR